jgi:hypothetical protein
MPAELVNISVVPACVDISLTFSLRDARLILELAALPRRLLDVSLNLLQAGRVPVKCTGSSVLHSPFFGVASLIADT